MRTIAHITVMAICISLACSATASDCPPALTWAGEANGSMYGWDVMPVGDMNGDGLEELCVAAPGYTSDSTGRVYVYSGSDYSVLLQIDGEAVDDMFGASVAGADLNGDGLADLLVAAPENNGNGTVYIFYGDSLLAPAALPATDADAMIEGLRHGGMFGYEIAVLSDIDADDCSDVAISEPDWIRANLSSLYPDAEGYVHVYSGLTLDPLYVLSGDRNKDAFGMMVREVGDVNDDGAPDLMVGATHIINEQQHAVGRAHLYTAADGTLLRVYMGEVLGDAFGYGIAGPGDLNHDGYDDIILGAHHINTLGYQTGEAYIFYGEPISGPDSVYASSADMTYVGVDSAYNFGGDIEALGDINADGFDDYAIAAFHWVLDGSGIVYLYSGLNGSLIAEIGDTLTRGGFGYHFNLTWDIDGDGIRDMAVGSPTHPPNGILVGPGEVKFFAIGDLDNDLVLAGADNCTDIANPGQQNSDGDLWGDACDNCAAVSNPDQGITIGMTGDVNTNGSLTSADIIYMVGYVFKGSNPPLPCAASGDVNCNGSVTSADIIYLVAHVFKGGPAPCNVCQVAGLGWSCP